MTSKLNKTVYNKLVLQAEEARDLGLIKLANNVFGAVGAVAMEDKISYNEDRFMEDIRNGLWKIATDVIAYHDLNGADIQVIDGVIDDLAEKVVANIESVLGVEGDIGALEEKVFGQK